MTCCWTPDRSVDYETILVVGHPITNGWRVHQEDELGVSPAPFRPYQAFPAGNNAEASYYGGTYSGNVSRIDPVTFEPIWTYYLGKENRLKRPMHIEIDADGGIYIYWVDDEFDTGNLIRAHKRTASPATASAGGIVKLDSSGAFQWERKFGAKHSSFVRTDNNTSEHTTGSFNIVGSKIYAGSSINTNEDAIWILNTSDGSVDQSLSLADLNAPTDDVEYNGGTYTASDWTNPQFGMSRESIGWQVSATDENEVFVLVPSFTYHRGGAFIFDSDTLDVTWDSVPSPDFATDGAIPDSSFTFTSSSGSTANSRYSFTYFARLYLGDIVLLSFDENRDVVGGMNWTKPSGTGFDTAIPTALYADPAGGTGYGVQRPISWIPSFPETGEGGAFPFITEYPQGGGGSPNELQCITGMANDGVNWYVTCDQAASNSAEIWPLYKYTSTEDANLGLQFAKTTVDVTNSDLAVEAAYCVAAKTNTF